MRTWTTPSLVLLLLGSAAPSQDVGKKKVMVTLPVLKSITDVLAGAALRDTGWFKPAALKDLAAGVARAAGAPSNRAWLLLCLGLWLEHASGGAGGVSGASGRQAGAVA